MSSPTALVTGANGFVASQLVKQLLGKGYRVIGTVRDPTNVSKVGHLTALGGDLELVQANLLDDTGVFDGVVAQSDVVFHTASPFVWKVDHPDDLLKPAVEGTLSVLRSVAKAGHTPRVVLTSSTAAVAVQPSLSTDRPVSEADWSDEDFMRSKGFVYPLSKTLAERSAWDFRDALTDSERFGLVTINPVYVLGSMLQPSLNTSSADIKRYLDGSMPVLKHANYACVDVEDVAAMHIAAAERPEATGRFLAVGPTPTMVDIAEHLRQLFPEYGDKIPTAVEDGDPKPQLKYDTSRAEDLLGITFTSLDTTLKRTVESLKEHGHV